MGKAIKVRASFTDNAGNAESVTSDAVDGPYPLTATTRDAPRSHDGSTAFAFELRFSEAPAVGFATVRDHAFTVTGGSLDKVRRLVAGQQRLVGDHCHAVLGSRRDPGAQCHHQLLRRGRDLQRRRGEVVRCPGAGRSADVEPAIPGHRRSHHQRHGAGGRDFDRLNVGHRRCRRRGQRNVQLPMARRRH